MMIMVLLSFLIISMILNVCGFHSSTLISINYCYKNSIKKVIDNRCLHSSIHINSIQLYSSIRNNGKGDLINNNNNELIMNIPNILTISRIIMIPFFIFAFISKKITYSTIIFLITCITDLLDGILARKLNQTSKFGAFLDPVADKLMVASALIMLSMYFPIWWYTIPVAITLCREIMVSAIREWMAEKGQRNSVKVGNIGKLKTATQMISIASLLQACSTIPDTHILGKLRPTFFTIGFLLFYTSTFLCTWSGIIYFYDALPSFFNKPNNDLV